MITRSANRKDSSTQSDIVLIEQSQRSNEKNTLKNSNEKNTDDANVYDFPSPTFNIHIHVPYHDPNNAKLFLPRIQPVIHLHFDEIAKRLEATMKGQNEKSLYKIFENWVIKASPKFGDVKFHFKNNSEEKGVEESTISTEIPCSSHMFNDTELNGNNTSNSEYNQSLMHAEVVTIENSDNHTAKPNSKNYHSYPGLSNYKLDKSIKLKNAVVVLTDICKTKNYKKILAGNDSSKNQNIENDNLSVSSEKVYNTCKDNEECDTYLIKAEKESCTPGSYTSDSYKNDLNIIDKCPVNNNNNNNNSNNNNLQVEKEISKSPLKKLSKNDQNLTSLVEGWNFSDILNRFQIKHHEYLVNSSKYLENTTADVIDSPEKNKNYLEKDMEKNHFSDNESYVEFNENERPNIDDDYMNETKSDAAESRSASLLHIKSETESNIFSSHLDLGESRVYDYKSDTSGDLKTEGSENQCYDTNSSSDECEKTSGEQVSTEACMDVEFIESDLSSNNCEIVFEGRETKNICLSDPDFHLVLIQKEMQRRALKSPTNKNKINQTKKNRKVNKSAGVQSPQSESTPSPKKMKHSNKVTENSGQKSNSSTTGDDYILLNSSGPTQFAVASLDKITSFKDHEAKDFKRKMLFGNSVNRFSSSDELKVHQLKREATRKALKKKEKTC